MDLPDCFLVSRITNAPLLSYGRIFILAGDLSSDILSYDPRFTTSFKAQIITGYQLYYPHNKTIETFTNDSDIITVIGTQYNYQDYPELHLEVNPAVSFLTKDPKYIELFLDEVKKLAMIESI